MVKIIKIKEMFVEINTQQEEEIMCDSKFVCAGSENYQKLVNSKILKYEIGYIIINNIKERLILKQPIKDLVTRRRIAADTFEKKFDLFVPYWQYEHTHTPKNEIGRMFGCKIML